jgi:hypothetical protein
MWKFLRKHHNYKPNHWNDFPLESILLAQEEFGIDIVYPSLIVPCPCLYPNITDWRDDVTVEVDTHMEGDIRYWRRRIHTPEGTLSDVKRAVWKDNLTGSSTPEPVEPLVKDLEKDIPRLHFMLVDPAKIDIDQAQQIDWKLGDRGLGIAHTYGPLDQRDVMTQADFMMLYYDDRGAFREIVDIMAKGMMSETKRILESGYKIIQGWWFYTSPSYGWGPKTFEDVFLPYVIQHVELVHSYPDTVYIYYDDGRVAQFIDFYVDSGIDCLMTLTPPPAGDADPQTIKGKYGKRIALMGGIDVVSEVCFSTPEAIRETVKRRMEVYKPGGGYIFDTTGSIPYETPVENVRALAEAAREFGSY